MQTAEVLGAPEHPEPLLRLVGGVASRGVEVFPENLVEASVFADPGPQNGQDTEFWENLGKRETEKAPPTPDLVRVYLNEIDKIPRLEPEEEVGLAQRIEAGLAARQVLELREIKRGNRYEIPEEVKESYDPKVLGMLERFSGRSLRLLEQAAGEGEEAKRQMVEANLRLVVSRATRFPTDKIGLLDAIQWGNLGLIRAVEKFDYTKGFKFSTYACDWIDNFIQQGMASDGHDFSLSRDADEKLRRWTTARTAFREQGVEPTLEQLADAARVSRTRVHEFARISDDIMRLDQVTIDRSARGNNRTNAIGDLIPDDSQEAVGAVHDTHSMQRELLQLVDSLEPREALLVKLLRGLHDGHEYGMAEAAERLNITVTYALQIERAAMQKLRERAPGSGLGEYL